MRCYKAINVCKIDITHPLNRNESLKTLAPMDLLTGEVINNWKMSIALFKLRLWQYNRDIGSDVQTRDLSLLFSNIQRLNRWVETCVSEAAQCVAFWQGPNGVNCCNKTFISVSHHVHLIGCSLGLLCMHLGNVCHYKCVLYIHCIQTSTKALEGSVTTKLGHLKNNFELTFYLSTFKLELEVMDILKL